MNRREFLKVGAVSFIGASLPLPIYHYLFSGNSNEVLKYHIKGILENQVEFETNTKFVHPLSGQELEKDMKGSGTIVNYHGEDYIFTANHLTAKEDVDLDIPSGSMSMPVESTDESKLGVNVLERIVSNRDRDIAIFKLPESYKTPDYKVRLADSDDIEILDEVYLLGKPLNIRRNIREGIVANKVGVTRFPNGNEVEGFNISTGGYFGDSGSPAINSDGEIIGFFSQLHFLTTSAFIRPINWYKEAVNEYEVEHGRSKPERG